MIGAQKQRSQNNNTAAFYFQHYVNWSPAGNLTTGNQVVLYAMYPGWDDSKPKDGAKNIWAGSALFTVTSVTGNLVNLSYTSSTGVDLSTL
jgi:hypothetical protein